MSNRDKTIEIIAKELDVETDVVSEGTTLDELGTTSPQLLEIALGIEEHFKVKVSDDSLAEFRTVGDIIEYVQAHVGG